MSSISNDELVKKFREELILNTDLNQNPRYSKLDLDLDTQLYIIYDFFRLHSHDQGVYKISSNNKKVDFINRNLCPYGDGYPIYALDVNYFNLLDLEGILYVYSEIYLKDYEDDICLILEELSYFEFDKLTLYIYYIFYMKHYTDDKDKRYLSDRKRDVAFNLITNICSNNKKSILASLPDFVEKVKQKRLFDSFENYFNKLVKDGVFDEYKKNGHNLKKAINWMQDLPF